MEYTFYARQAYRLKEGVVQARVLPAQEAEAFDHKDGYTAQEPEGRLCIDDFDSETTARHHLEGLTDCRIMNWEELRRWQ